MTSNKGSRFYNHKFLTSSSVFSTQKTYPCTFLGSNNYINVFYLRFMWFWDHFAHFWGSVTSQKGSRFQYSNFRLYYRFSLLKKITHAYFQIHTNIYRVFWGLSWFSGHFGWFWGFVTSQKGQDFRFLNFWLYNRFSLPKKIAHAHFKIQKIIFTPWRGKKKYQNNHI